MSYLVINTSSANLAASSHTLATKRSFRNFVKHLAEVSIEEGNELEDIEFKNNIADAIDYVTSHDNDIENIDSFIEDNKVKQLRFTFKKKSETGLNLAYSILLIIKAITGDMCHALIIFDSCTYATKINDDNELIIINSQFDNFYYDPNDF